MLILFKDDTITRPVGQIGSFIVVYHAGKTSKLTQKYHHQIF